MYKYLRPIFVLTNPIVNRNVTTSPNVICLLPAMGCSSTKQPNPSSSSDNDIIENKTEDASENVQTDEPKRTRKKWTQSIVSSVYSNKGDINFLKKTANVNKKQKFTRPPPDSCEKVERFRVSYNNDSPYAQHLKKKNK